MEHNYKDYISLIKNINVELKSKLKHFKDNQCNMSCLKRIYNNYFTDNPCKNFINKNYKIINEIYYNNQNNDYYKYLKSIINNNIKNINIIKNIDVDKSILNLIELNTKQWDINNFVQFYNSLLSKIIIRIISLFKLVISNIYDHIIEFVSEFFDILSSNKYYEKIVLDDNTIIDFIFKYNKLVPESTMKYYSYIINCKHKIIFNNVNYNNKLIDHIIHNAQKPYLDSVIIFEYFIKDINIIKYINYQKKHKEYCIDYSFLVNYDISSININNLYFLLNNSNKDLLIPYLTLVIKNYNNDYSITIPNKMKNIINNLIKKEKLFINLVNFVIQHSTELLLHQTTLIKYFITYPRKIKYFNSKFKKYKFDIINVIEYSKENNIIENLYLFGFLPEDIISNIEYCFNMLANMSSNSIIGLIKDLDKYEYSSAEESIYIIVNLNECFDRSHLLYSLYHTFTYVIINMYVKINIKENRFYFDNIEYIKKYCELNIAESLTHHIYFKSKCIIIHRIYDYIKKTNDLNPYYQQINIKNILYDYIANPVPLKIINYIWNNYQYINFYNDYSQKLDFEIYKIIKKYGVNPNSKYILL